MVVQPEGFPVAGTGPLCLRQWRHHPLFGGVDQCTGHLFMGHLLIVTASDHGDFFGGHLYLVK